MTEPVINERICEVPKPDQVQVAITREDVDNVNARLTLLDQRIGIVHPITTLLSERMVNLDIRIGRVEKSLGVADPE